jgi:hypothetical protein
MDVSAQQHDESECGPPRGRLQRQLGGFQEHRVSQPVRWGASVPRGLHNITMENCRFFNNRRPIYVAEPNTLTNSTIRKLPVSWLLEAGDALARQPD